MSLLIASVVPDVSGIDKVFDYIVPEALATKVWRGAKVRVDLNGRRVGGWIVELTTAENEEEISTRYSRLLSVAAVSGHGVEPEIVGLTSWVASYFWGSWRAVLSSASAPHVRNRQVHQLFGSYQDVQDGPLGQATQMVLKQQAGLLVVPPLASALTAVAQIAQKGPTLVVCPTLKMATLGAAWLRRKGLTTAVVPEQWDNARAGVDVVIGARSAVFAPCAQLSAVVVIDEHDELLHDERAPTWNATEIAVERARQLNIPCVLTSPTPSAESLHRFSNATVVVQTEKKWPKIEIVDLDTVAIAGSLLSSQLLSAVTQSGGSVACVLNTKGRARLIVCRSCRGVQDCKNCSALLTQNDDQELVCPRCSHKYGSVCIACGRTSFVVPRGGLSHLASQITASTNREVIEISGDEQDTWTKGSVFVGTEAVLHRVPGVEVVVFADIDRDLGAPRMTAAREVLALIGRAARLVGDNGKVIVHTRRPNHPLLQALGKQDVTESLMAWGEQDLMQRKLFSLPPFGALAHIGVKAPRTVDEILDISGVDIARFEDYVIVKAVDRDRLGAAISEIRKDMGTSVRVHVDPVRY